MDIFLKTERLLFRRFSEEDVEQLFLLDNDPEVMRITNGGKPTVRRTLLNQTIVKLLEYFWSYDRYGFWAVIRKLDCTFIGWFHFRPLTDNPDEMDLGYRLIRSAWGNGYATEGSRALIKKGFEELGIKKVSARALPENRASIRVMEKAGMFFEKCVRDNHGNELVQYAIEIDSFNL
jgi:RimJ/RimL family protein N-acetyltransferase